MSRMKEQDARVTIRMKDELLNRIIEAVKGSNYENVSSNLRSWLNANVPARGTYEEGDTGSMART